MIGNKYKRLVCGVGVNDANYKVKTTKVVNGKHVIVNYCEIYHLWKRMIVRCHSEKFKEKRPTYAECKVCDEWLFFSNFKRWADNLDYHGKHLDKDVINEGSLIYSPENCAFVTQLTNSFVVDCGAARGKYKIGVYLNKKANRLVAACRNPFTKKKEALGYFDCELEAHLTWKKRKHELACQLADMQTDERVANALRTRYL
jgi:hypothetical protein